LRLALKTPLAAEDLAQFDGAVRTLQSTAIGTELLRQIAACHIPDDELPVPVFRYGYPDLAEPEPALDAALPARSGSIKFLLHPDTNLAEGRFDVHNVEQLDQVVDLFSELVELYARRTNQVCVAPEYGLPKFSTLTLRDQFGENVPTWQRELEAYVHAARDDRDDRRGASTRIVEHAFYGTPDTPLVLASLGLVECPPLRNLTLQPSWVILNDNRLDAFPPAEQLPPNVVRVDLIGNPIRAGAADYGPMLQQVTAGGPGCSVEILKAALPPHVDMVVEHQHVRDHMQMAQLMLAFPDLMQDMVPIDAMASMDLTDADIRTLFTPDMLKDVVSGWLPDPNDSWLQAQQRQPAASWALATLLKRLDKLVPAANVVMRNDIAMLLAKIQQPGNEALRDHCLQIARDGAESCTDRIIGTLNELHIASLIADAEAGQYDGRIAELLDLGERMFNMQTLSEYIVGLMPILEVRAARERAARESANAGLALEDDEAAADQLQQFLVLQAALQDRVRLPLVDGNFRFTADSLMTDGEIAAAERHVVEKRKTGFVPFLASWSPMSSVIQRHAPHLAAHAKRLRTHVFLHRGPLYDTLDRLLNANGNLFTRPSPLAVFNVPYRVFWTPYERLVAQRLDDEGLSRDDQDSVVQVCKIVATEVEQLIQAESVRLFLASRGVGALPEPGESASGRLIRELRKTKPPRQA
jgi:hypothetical protein